VSYPTSEPSVPPEENTGYGWSAPTSPAPAPGAQQPEPAPEPGPEPTTPLPAAAPPPPVWMPPPPPPGSMPPARGPIALLVLAGVLVLAVCGAIGTVVFLSGSTTSHTTAADGSAGSNGAGSAPSASPSTSARLTNRDYGDWNFQWGEVKLNATKTAGKDFSTCAPAEHDSWLSDHGCQYGIELDYSAEGGTIRFEHLIMAFDTAEHASAAGKQVTEDDLQVNTKALNNPRKIGYWTRDETNEYMVITICTASRADLDAKVHKYLHYANADETVALSFRD